MKPSFTLPERVGVEGLALIFSLPLEYLERVVVALPEFPSPVSANPESGALWNRKQVLVWAMGPAWRDAIYKKRPAPSCKVCAYMAGQGHRR